MDTLFTNGDDPPEYYVNSMRVAANLYSFVFDLGVQGVPDAPGSEPPPIQRVAMVRMSPHHALALHKLLGDRLAKYQSDIGPINIPDKFMPNPQEGEQ